MKKTIYVFAFMTLLIAASIGCSKNNPIDCAAKLTKLQAKAAAYVADDNSENCKAYKAAIEDYMGSCSSGISAEQKAEFEAAIADMNCP